ncbi:hypothetical protein SDC9_141425 [bioreactor metagenome]|uniref:Uncharacterized protein n=1 Tax=bioreactor metagenome TaxID=1076179 RepID=A0A645DYD6_9ZZZZ
MNAEYARELIRGPVQFFRRDAEDEHAPLFANHLNGGRTQCERDALHQAALKIGAIEPF